MMTATFTTNGGTITANETTLHAKVWKSDISTRAAVVFVHGFSDHIARFDTFFHRLNNAGIDIYGFDQRGWGKSVTTKADKGNTGPTTTVIADIAAVIELVATTKETQGIPLFLMGHSMGGAEVLYFAAKGPQSVRHRLRGYLALAPYLRLHPFSQPSRALVLAGRVAKLVLPKMQMVQKLKPDALCRDLSVGASYENDELCHNTGTLEGLDGMINRGEELATDAVVVTEGSFLIAHGTGDLITSHDVSRAWYDRLQVQDKEFISYDGWYHVLHAEPGEDQIKYAKDLEKWILARAPTEDRSKL